jgi:hypothetical protein
VGVARDELMEIERGQRVAVEKCVSRPSAAARDESVAGQDVEIVSIRVSNHVTK